VYLKALEKHTNRVNNWLADLPEAADKFAIVYHGDCDGVVSAALFDYILRESLAKSNIIHIPVRTENYDFEQALSRIDQFHPDVTIFLDLSIQNHPDKLKKASDATRSALLIYDHHSQYNSEVPANTLYLNPSVTPEGYDENSPPPCLFTARLAHIRFGIDFDWAAGIGLIAESAVDHFMPLFQKLPDQFPGLCPGTRIKSPDDVYECKLKSITYSIAAAFWARPGEFEQMAFDQISRMIKENTPLVFFSRHNNEARQLIRMEKEVRAEINRLTAEAEIHSYYAPETSLRYAEIESEYRVGGVVATRLVRKHKSDIVVTGQEYTGRYVVEARCGNDIKVNVAEMLKAATSDLNPYSVGGHPVAAGATLPPESSTQFFIELENTVKAD
jgi:single-stranded DNA-specific DHH superfamily exonuclease